MVHLPLSQKVDALPITEPGVYKKITQQDVKASQSPLNSHPYSHTPTSLAVCTENSYRATGSTCTQCGLEISDL